LLQRWRRTGSVAPAARGKKPYALADDEVLVRELVAACPDMTLDELHAELGRRGIQVGRSSIGRFLLACGLTLKKSRFMPPSRTGQMSRLHARRGGQTRLA
jgi:transposase